MRVHNKIGSKERLFEMFENINNLKLNENILNEGVHDKGIFKAFIMGGGPGSGKSYVVKELFGFPKEMNFNKLSSYGLKLINSDDVFEYMLHKEGIDPKQLATISKTDPEMANKIMGKEPTSIRSKAKGITNNRAMHYLDGRLGVIIDGTGKNIKKNQNVANNLDMMGYDVYMIFITTSLETALNRNRNRSTRRLEDEFVKKLWNESMKTIEYYSNPTNTGIFIDKNNILFINNDDNTPVDEKIAKEVEKKINTPITNPTALKWIETEKKTGQDKSDRNKFKQHPSPEYIDFARTYRNRFKDTENTDLGREYEKHMNNIFGLPEA